MLDLRVDPLARLASVMVRYRRRVFACWLIAIVIGLCGLPRLLGSVVSPSIEVEGSESQRATEVLGAALPSLGNDAMIAVLNSETRRAVDTEFRAALGAGMAALGEENGVSGVVSLPLIGDPRPAPVLADTFEPLRPLFRDEHTAYLLVGLSGNDQERQDRVPAQQRVIDDAVQAASGGTVRAYLVGISAFGQAVQQAEIADLLRIELVAVPVAILVLLIGLRAPVAALVPAGMAGAAVLTALGVFALLDDVLRVDGMLLVGTNAVGLGVGIDYALFVMNRYREELSGGAPPERAVATAAATTGRTVVYSGLILALACTSLFLVRWPVFAQAAVGVMVVTAAALAASVSLLPAALIPLTRWLEWRPRWMPEQVPGRKAKVEGRDRLARWAAHLMRRPWRYAIAVTAGLLLAAVPMADMQLGINLERRALAGTPDRIGQEIVDRDSPGLTSTLLVVVQRPADTAAPDTGPLVDALRADAEVAGASVIDDGVAVQAVIVVPRHLPDSPAVVRLVERIRTQIVPAAAPPGLPVLVGGSSALVADLLTETSRKLWWVVGCVLTMMFVVLVAVLRSVLLPLKAILMSLLATGASFGLTVLLFQGYTGDDVVDPADPGLLWPQVPLVVFVLLFGLSTDYELFLVRRIQEEYSATGDNRVAVATGLQRTARPISLAAAILAVAFGSLLVSDINGLRAFGFAIAAALIIDATVIRLVLVPALMQIMGRWNWWLPAIAYSGKHLHRPEAVSAAQ
ncbi:MMPL domain-containing protein [Nocardia brasiliensis ATCC 700358]|uniref:MMPL domain-containing protein n=1 Tax=Nocardia brasiliensis (strain ATCC 700358 / HUJEG-1) TaxID=1133849 RepID=K0EIQ0_NOCB7|nr:MMPL domain-containing protein [Nocardia brasiliensis ATCC 700358]